LLNVLRPPVETATQSSRFRDVETPPKRGQNLLFPTTINFRRGHRRRAAECLGHKSHRADWPC
jgi:hypothetical protein